MSLTMKERDRLRQILAMERFENQLRQADAKLQSGIDFVAADIPEFRIRRPFLSGQQVKPVLNPRMLRIVALSLMVAAVVLTVVLCR